MDSFLLKKDKNLKNFILATSIYSGTSILGPIIVLGCVGYFLDLYFKTKPLMIFIALVLSFAITNILLFKKGIAISKYFNQQEEASKNSKDE